MEYSRLIHDYLDGELNPLLEDKLFTEMAVNQDVRSEFSKQVRLNSFTRQDMDSIYIPSESTEAIFTSLGFSIPSASIPNVGVRYYWSWLKKHSLGTVSAILALLLMISASWQMFNQNIGKSEIDLSAKSVKVSESQNKNTSNKLVGNPNNQLVKSDNIVKNNQFAMTSSKELVSKHNSRVFNSGNNSIVADEADNSVKIEEMQSHGETLASSSNKFFTNKSVVSIYSIEESDLEFRSYSEYNRNMIFQQGVEIHPFDFSGLNLDVTWSKSKYQYNKTLNLASDEHSFLFGNDVTIMYRINDEHSLGIALGEEEFYQEFTYHTGEQVATYKQIPNYFWGGVSYRYTPTDLKLGESIQPYSKVIAGGAKGGIIAKIEMGVSMRITPSISVFAGGEYGAMVYNIRDKMYNSDKFKFLYGINMSL